MAAGADGLARGAEHAARTVAVHVRFGSIL